MYYAMAVLTGGLLALVVAANGGLAGWYGVYGSTVVIHLLGFLVMAVVLLAGRQSPILRKKLPFYCFLGGILGIFSTVFNNIAFTAISVSAITALGLLGQSVTSVLVDSLGLFRVKRRPFEVKKLLGYALIVLGAIVMLAL